MDGHGRLDGPLDGTAVGHALFELPGDVVGHQLCINLRALDFTNVDADFLAGQMMQLVAKPFDLFAFFSDHHAGAGGKNVGGDFLRGSLDADAGDRRMTQATLEIAAQNDVFIQQFGEIIFGGTFNKGVL